MHLAVEPLMTAREAAQVLGLRLDAFYAYARQGVIPIVRISRTIRVSPHALREFIASGGLSESPSEASFASLGSEAAFARPDPATRVSRIRSPARR